MKHEQTELLPAERPSQVPAAPQARQEAASDIDIIRLAVENNADVDKLERLIEMRKAMLAETARKTFFAAMNAVQTEIEPIRKDATNSFTRTKYALLETIHKALCPVYTKHGFAIAFSEGDAKTPDGIRVSAVVMHKDGHSQEYHVDLALDAAGAKGASNKTDVQAKGSTFSYGRRYLEMMIFNLSLTNEDDDGNAGRGQVISENESRNLRELCEAAGRPIEKVLQAAGVNDLAHYPKSAYENMAPMLREAADKRH